ncbi:spore germination protein GerPE [Oceanobacillus piezotolerans]|uniref:Spore germination protein GerPE n=1 Tax=Oceanobacillus piezotolerans TaxID=2448030 RepID=A0A498D5P2_9BACI|nr:spore germination protein GerPE [Oceanobacillus piezotolerans]RLL45038.1 spore germination protein GerPE [Oceanobacillus piezotolerans]
MNKRTSEVDTVQVTSFSTSAIFNIGDTNQSNQKSRGIAVQKEGSLADFDLQFEDYPIFKRDAVWPKQRTTVRKHTYHHSPVIQVQNVNIIGVSTSSVLQIGSLEHIRAESRIKHFRMLER